MKTQSISDGTTDGRDIARPSSPPGSLRTPIPGLEQQLRKVTRFARRELDYHVAIGDLGAGDVSVGDIVDAVALRAFREGTRRPPDLELGRWLLKVTLDAIEAEIARLQHERDAGGVDDRASDPSPEPPPLSRPREPLENHDPEDDLWIADVVAAPAARSPEQIAEQREMQAVVTASLRDLPRVWRRAFVLHHVDGLSVAEVSHVTGQPARDVDRSIEHARAFLRQKLAEADRQSRDRRRAS